VLNPIFKHFMPLPLMIATKSRRIPKIQQPACYNASAIATFVYARQISQIMQAAYKYNTQAEIQAAYK